MGPRRTRAMRVDDASTVPLSIKMKAGLDRSFRDVLSKREIAGARARAANRAAALGRRTAAAEVTQRTGLPSAEVRKAVTVSTKAGRDRPVATVRGFGRPRNLRAFQAVRLRRGVRAKPYGRRRVFAGTFMLPDGRVFRRDASRINPSRPGPLTSHSEGLEALYGPGVADTFGDVVRERRWKREVRQRLASEMKGALEGQLRRKRGRAAKRARRG